MSESKEIAVAEQPQQLITIEPTKYVALVFENHRTRADAYKAEAPTVTYDITTTAGMKTAVEWRAKGRDIRVEVTDIHKERKAPILEIGRLMDARKKEIIADVEPDEERFDRDIKSETARKEAEKAAKAAVEAERIRSIKARIEGFMLDAVTASDLGAAEIDAHATHLSETPITLEEFREFSGEAEVKRNDTVKWLRERQQQAAEREAEQARIAAEREALERQRAELAEQERQAAAARAEQEAKDRAEQERVAAEQEAAAAAMRQQQLEHEARMAAQQAELDRQQAELERQRAEAARIERERLEAIEAEAQAKRDAEEAAAKLEADHAEGLLENARIDAAREAAFEAQQQENQRRADEAERIRRERVQFELNGPDAREMIEVLAAHYQVEQQTILNWINRWVWAEVEVTA